MGIFLAIGVAFFFAAKSSPSPAPLAQQPDATLEPKDQKTLEHPPVENPSDPMPPDAPPDVEEKIPTESNPAEKPPSEANKEPTESTEPPVVEQPMPPPQPMPIVEVDEPKSPVNPANDPLKLADLRKLDRLLAPNAAPPEPTEKPSAPATPEDLATTSEPLPRPEMRKVNAQARLADKIAFLDCQGRPVLDFLQVVSDFSTVPISLDPWALAWSRITPDQPLKNQMTNVTVLQALQQTMQPFRLEPVVHDNHVWITRSATPRTIPYPCDGLVNDAKQLTQLASMVKALTPDAWSAKEHTIKAEGTTLTIHNTEAVHIQILELLERLRVARGLPIKSKFPVTMFSLETRTARMRVKLAQPLTLNYAQPTPLAKILKQFHQETGIHFLVDWYALAQEGWPTDSEASVVLDKTPLGGALSKLLHPMDLDFHIIDDQTIQVTSRTQLESTRELELHRVADLLSSEETETSLAERMQAVMGDRVLARYDAPSRTFFVLASQPDQQKLAGLLDSWRRMAGK
jgi:hypothetical protein